MDERDVLRVWREFFPNGNITPQALTQAESFLEELDGESPLRLRMANELAELKKSPAARKKTGRKPAT